MKKILFFLLLASVIIFIPRFTSNVVSADTLLESDGKTVIFQMTEEEIEAEHKRQIEAEVFRLTKSSNLKDDGVIRPFDDPSDYRIEYGTRKVGSVEGFAGNQTTGVRFPTLGGFYYSTSGGPTTTLNLSFPEPYDWLSLSVPLGNKSTSGIYVAAPNTTDYFKLSVIKDYSVQPYIVYRYTYDTNLGYNTWQVFNKSHNITHVGTQAYAKKVPSPY